MIIWTYRLVSDGRPERVQAVITEGGEGHLIGLLEDLPKGVIPADILPAHHEVARELAGCPIQIERVRPAGAGCVFRGFPEGEGGPE